jgi:hypothetical protein
MVHGETPKRSAACSILSNGSIEKLLHTVGINPAPPYRGHPNSAVD